jgi:uncharacterized protein
MYGTARMRWFAMMVAAALGAGLMPGRGQTSPEQLATDVANDLVNRRLAAIVARFTPEMASGLPLPTLERVWGGVLQQGGPVRELAPARLVQVTSAGVALVIVPIMLERVTLDLKISVVHEQIAGLFITPSSLPAETWNAPDYVDSAKFANVDVTVGPTGLGGTLTLPKTGGKVPAVVLIQGSGPHDRDETIGPNRPFRDIAEGLASRGVAAPVGIVRGTWRAGW